MRSLKRSWQLYVGTALFAIIVALVLTACGGSSSSSSSGGSEASTGSKESAEPAESSDPAESEESEAGGSSSLVAEAKAAAEEAEKPPTKIGVTEPLKTKPESGKTFVWLQCNYPQCAEIGNGVKEGAEAIGWKYKSIPYTSADPATLVSGFKEALGDDPAAVGLSGLPEQVYASVLPEYKSAGVPIVASFVGKSPLEPPLIANIAGIEAKIPQAEALSDWAIADSDGKANVLMVRVDEFTLYKEAAGLFTEDLEGKCPECSVEDLKLTIPDTTSGKVNPAIVSALQRNPELEYVFASDGVFIEGLPAALKAAGLDVKVIGYEGTAENLSAIKKGEEDAFTGEPASYSGWQIIDAALRHEQGIEFPEADGGLPLQLLTQNSEFEVTGDYKVPKDFPEQFKKLWKVE